MIGMVWKSVGGATAVAVIINGRLGRGRKASPLPLPIKKDKDMARRDTRTKYPTAMEEYLEDYGYHFNKKLFEFAAGMMYDRAGRPLAPWDKEKTMSVLKNNGVSLNKDYGHDATYVINMARADYWGSSISDEAHLALFVKDYLDDPDGSPTRAFDEFYIKTVALGIPIFWDEML